MKQADLDIPRECPNPNCRLPINENRHSWQRLQTTCGSDACRQYLYRAKRAERLDIEREETRTSIRHYCETHLTSERAEPILEITALLMQDKDRGHLLARQIIEAIESKRCKHDKIAILEANAHAAKLRAEKAEAYNQQLSALYEQRIRELEEIIAVSQSVENLIHHISQEQVKQQPEDE